MTLDLGRIGAWFNPRYDDAEPSSRPRSDGPRRARLL